MIKTIPFQTRARTIDHLGREQIADCPTAISELWKNSFDAYARHVYLDIHEGNVPIAAVGDDGHGMSEAEFLDRWLVVGTDSKLNAAETSAVDRLGLPLRARQGQKGIGRLSCAALGPMALIISKRKGLPFVAALLDWRLFRNPFLLLHDIEIPVISFDARSQLIENLDALTDRLVANVWGAPSEPERSGRIEAAWAAFDELEKRQGVASTREAIASTVIRSAFSETHLARWPVWSGDAECGTLLLVADLAYDLLALLASESDISNDPLVKDARDRVFRTLSSFVDPFVDPKKVKNEFHYRIEALRDGSLTTFLSDKREFDFSAFGRLEHIIIGEVDSQGVFKGRVKAFGKTLEEHVVIKPKLLKSPTGSQWKVGPFSFRAGAYERLRVNSALDDDTFAFVDEQAERYGGLFLFRDGLRVLPFGRPDNDFFEIERRRSQSVGREFWSYRRMFGSISISIAENPNLRDKAGREGLIDNESAKVFRQIVEGILTESAYRYFGSGSDLRAGSIESIKSANKARKAKEEQRKLAKKRRDEFRKKVRDQIQDLRSVLATLVTVGKDWEGKKPSLSEAILLERRAKLESLERELHDLDVGEAPPGLQSFEETSDEYAAIYAKASALVAKLNVTLFRLLDQLRDVDPVAVFEKERSKRQRDIESIVNRFVSSVGALQRTMFDSVKEIGREQVSSYTSQVNDLYREVMGKRVGLSPALQRLDNIFSLSRTEVEQNLGGLLSTFEALRDNIDLSAVAYSGLEDVSQLREELAKVNALAQLGITVEIIGHELESLDASISRGLAALPKSVQGLPAYHTTANAHDALTERLRFLSPLKLSGDQEKEWISGADIEKYLAEFFGDILVKEGINLSASQEFKKFRVFDRKSRIFPVFVNLANNSRYWIAQGGEKPGKIALGLKEGSVVFADNGPGVDVGDIKSLFNLFFTRKPRGGRGVGLYLCRTNLAAGGHKIRYGESKDQKILDGANFLIDFLGAEYD